MSQRAYDSSELAKLRSAVLSGAGLNLVMSFMIKKRGASILLHRAIVGLAELLIHPIFLAHVLPQTGLMAGHPLTRVSRPFPPPMNMMEMLAKAGGGSPPVAGAAEGGDDDEVGEAIPVSA